MPQIRIAGTSVSEATKDMPGASAMGSLDVKSIPSIEIAFFLAVMIHAIGDGIMAGVLQTGSIADGMRHSFIMLLLGIAALTFI
jgi:flagellar protein FlaJ